MERFIEDFNRYNYANLELKVSSRSYRVYDKRLNKEVLFPGHKNGKLDHNRYFKFRSVEDDYVYPEPSYNADFHFEKHKGIYFEKYGEFFVSLKELDFVKNSCDSRFTIGETLYEVGKPSDLMLLFFGNYTENNCEYLTIKVHNTSKKYFKRDVEKGLFYLGNAMPGLKGYPKIRSFVPNNAKAKAVQKGLHLDLDKINWESPYIESISILNKAKTYKDLLSYYRFLEYFFIISQIENLKKQVVHYGEKLEAMTEKDDLQFVKKFTAITNQEKDSLTRLLERLDEDKIIQTFESLGLKENAKDEVTIEYVSSKLYTFRNENVHAKKHNKGKIDFCNSFLNDNHNAWMTMFELLSEMVVKEFLYNS